MIGVAVYLAGGPAHGTGMVLRMVAPPAEIEWDGCVYVRTNRAGDQGWVYVPADVTRGHDTKEG